MPTFHAYAATTPHSALQPFTFDPGELGPEEVEIKVSYCGICRSDISMLDNEWSMSKFPFVPGHEAVGTVVALGEEARGSRLASVWASGGRLIAVSRVTSACPEITISARLIKAPWWAATAAFRIDCASNGPGHVRYPTGSISRKPVRCYAAAIPYSRLSFNTTYPRRTRRGNRCRRPGPHGPAIRQQMGLRSPRFHHER